MNRTILHCDFNNFFASVECLENPSLKNEYVAVCGDPSERKGIILAKNEKAKRKGVKTGEPIWQAMKKCPHLVLVPPHFDKYFEYSKAAGEIYFGFTDLVEPFGMDESWLDISGSLRLFGSGVSTALKIKEKIRKELGLTISVGVSFNKVFSKLGSDMEKPDGLFEINRYEFKNIIKNLDISRLIGAGPSTAKLLLRYGIKTMGQVANLKPEFLQSIMGKRGVILWKYVNGYENSPVLPYGYTTPLKSIGHGTTVRRNLENENEVWRVIYELSQKVGERLRKTSSYAFGVELDVKDSELKQRSLRGQLVYPTKNSYKLSELAFKLFKENYTWENPVRALAIRAVNLIADLSEVQLDFGVDLKKESKTERIDFAVDKIHKLYGEKSVTYGSLMGDWQTPMPSVLPAPTPFFTS